MFVGVNSGNTRQAVAAYVKHVKIPWPMIVDTSRELERAIGISKMKVPQISLPNIEQAFVITAEGELKLGDFSDIPGTIALALKGARWNIAPTRIPASLRGAWQAVELGNYSHAAEDLQAAVKSPATKKAAELLLAAVDSQLKKDSDAAWNLGKQKDFYGSYLAITKLQARYRGFEIPEKITNALKWLEDQEAVQVKIEANSVAKKPPPVVSPRADARVLAMLKDAALILNFEEDSFYRAHTFVKDLSDQQNNGFISSANIIKGKAGLGLQFDGQRDYVEFPTLRAKLLRQLKAISILGWVRYAPSRDVKIVFDMGITTAESVSVFIKNNGLNFALPTDHGGKTVFSGVIDKPNEWHHFSAVWDGKEQKIYIDGTLRARAKTESLILNESTVHDFPARIGIHSKKGKNLEIRDFAGGIDEFVILTRALSDKEIAAIYQAGQKGLPLAAPAANPGPNNLTIATATADFRPNANHHADGTASGTWSYLTSQQVNPRHPDANLRAMGWDSSEGIPQHYEIGADNSDGKFTFPNVIRRQKALSLIPGPQATVVLRWTSKIDSAVVLKGYFRRPRTETRGNPDGATPIVYVDGKVHFSQPIKHGDTSRHDFQFAATVKKGSTIDFVIDKDGPGQGRTHDFDDMLFDVQISSSGNPPPQGR